MHPRTSLLASINLLQRMNAVPTVTWPTVAARLTVPAGRYLSPTNWIPSFPTLPHPQIGQAPGTECYVTPAPDPSFQTHPDSISIPFGHTALPSSLPPLCLAFLPGLCFLLVAPHFFTLSKTSDMFLPFSRSWEKELQLQRVWRWGARREGGREEKAKRRGWV